MKHPVYLNYFRHGQDKSLEEILAQHKILTSLLTNTERLQPGIEQFVWFENTIVDKAEDQDEKIEFEILNLMMHQMDEAKKNEN